MTCFVLSHNLQVQSEDLPALSAAELAAGLQAHGDWISTVEPLAHPHWLVKLEAEGSADELADAPGSHLAVLPQGMRTLRGSQPVGPWGS